MLYNWLTVLQNVSCQKFVSLIELRMIFSFCAVNSDYQPLPPNMVTFAVGGGTLGAPSMANVQIMDDNVGEADESFILSLIPMSSANDQGLSVPITIIDDERECSNVLSF